MTLSVSNPLSNRKLLPGLSFTGLRSSKYFFVLVFLYKLFVSEPVNVTKDLTLSQ